MIVGFSLHSVLHVAPSIVALLGAGTMLLVTNVDVTEILPEVEWPTLVFFMGLFAMVAGLVHTGVIGWLGDLAVAVFGDNYFAAATGLLFGSAVLGAFVDNIPYTATMTPVVEGMVAQAPDTETGRALWWAFALGACFSGNGTAIAASANVVAIGIAATRGSRDQLLAVHPLRHRGDAAEHRPGVGLRLAALLLSRPQFPVRDRGGDVRLRRQRVIGPRDVAVRAHQHGGGQGVVAVHGMHDVGTVDVDDRVRHHHEPALAQQFVEPGAATVDVGHALADHAVIATGCPRIVDADLAEAASHEPAARGHSCDRPDGERLHQSLRLGPAEHQLVERVGQPKNRRADGKTLALIAVQKPARAPSRRPPPRASSPGSSHRRCRCSSPARRAGNARARRPLR